MIECTLVAGVRLKVHAWWIDLEHGVTMVPSEHFDAVRLTLLHDSHLFERVELTILLPVSILRSTWLCRIDSTYNDVLHSLICTTYLNIGLVYVTAKKSNHLMLRQICVNEHQHLHLEGKIDAVGLLIPFWVLLTGNKLILTRLVLLLVVWIVLLLRVRRLSRLSRSPTPHSSSCRVVYLGIKQDLTSILLQVL